MTAVRVKICGLTREEDVECAINEGADAVGFICGFPESPRNLSLARVGDLMETVPPFVDRILVTRSKLLKTGSERIKGLRPSALQVYGRVQDSYELKEKFQTKLILPFAVKKGENRPPAVDGFDAVLSDTYLQGRFGGTGRASDWDACSRLKKMLAPVPFILSGGLNPENVEQAISCVEPFAVDTSSGVEASPGIKDPAKVRAFIRRATGGG